MVVKDIGFRTVFGKIENSFSPGRGSMPRGPVRFPPGGGLPVGDAPSRPGFEIPPLQETLEFGRRRLEVEPRDIVPQAIAMSLQYTDAFGDWVLDDTPENHMRQTVELHPQPRDKEQEKKQHKTNQTSSVETSRKASVLFHCPVLP
jgi:hypothetical protein